MKRLHLVEICDSPRCLDFVHEGVARYLQVLAHLQNPYRCIVPVLRRALERSRARRIVDLGSGTGGPWSRLAPAVLRGPCADVGVTLTDLRPRAALGWSDRRVRVFREPVDALRVPQTLTGFRTVFSLFHHFSPCDARRILSDAVDAHTGIAVFEMTSRSLFSLWTMLMTTVVAFLATPFIRPFLWRQWLFTYLVPLIPLAATFDGVVSCLRTYTPAEMRALVAGLGDTGYTWEIGELRPFGLPFFRVAFLVGYPAAAAEQISAPAERRAVSG